VSGGNALAVALALGAGLGGSVQAAVLGRLGDRIGTLEAVAFSTLVAFVVGTAALLVARMSLDGIWVGARQPAWLWLGGVISAFIVLSITLATPRIGVAATVGLLIAGNLVMAALIDRFGWFGGERIPLGWARLLGIALLAAGAALSLRK
jgi:transporter family-2 protein